MSNFWQDLGKTVSTVGAAAGKPLELLGGVLSATGVGASVGVPLAGLGAVLAHTFGTANDPSAIKQAIEADPQAAEKLYEVQAATQVQLQQLAVSQSVTAIQEETKRQQLAFSDTASARDMHVTTREKTPEVLTFVVCGGFFGLLLVLAFFSIPVENKEALSQVLGALTLAFGAVVQFWVGTNRSSQNKDATIAEAQRMLGNSTPLTVPADVTGKDVP